MHRIPSLVFLLIALLFSSCFDIIEELDLNSDGSGHFELTINCSESKTKIASIMMMDQIKGYKIPSEKAVEEAISRIENLAKDQEGIHSVIKTVDFEEYITSISLDFDHIDSLNVLIKKAIIQESDESISLDGNHFEWLARTGELKRFGDYILVKENMPIEQEYRPSLDQAEYVCISRFDQDILNSLNENSRISPSKKAVMNRYSVLDLLERKAQINNTITLKLNP